MIASMIHGKDNRQQDQFTAVKSESSFRSAPLLSPPMIELLSLHLVHYVVQNTPEHQACRAQISDPERVKTNIN